ncbi:surfactin synthase thioesterase subunit [Allocatelliglobosispora scoriae]|uniref:Surfactin synthase thioesterase subunit n=1 Tax=Allocatelliglobosispora scoriae TaxID=643052 RepID=A0A841BFH0_9ACTN|nr:thioesterase [Allocatelliglobosispora scoriae]MBB5867837.1 surfactin synthase thioesterase subunit [Allocatelliglobosispora scoriae]
MTTEAGRWLPSGRRPDPDAAVRLLCLPHAGGGASSYRAWRAAFPPGVDVLPLQLTGRETRRREPHSIDIGEIASAVAAYADRPYALFGLSMGARIAFETARELRHRRFPPPIGLYVAAALPPDAPDPLVGRLAVLPDDELLTELIGWGGMPAAILAETELLAMILPVLRADLRWLAAAVHRRQEPLEIPIVAFAGEDDPSVRPAQLIGWADHTLGTFDLHTLPGSHFAVHEDPAAVARVLTPRLGRTGRAAPAGPR